MKVKNKLFIILSILCIMLVAISTISFADYYTPNDFKGKITTTGTGTSNIKTVGGEIVGMIQIVGTIIAVGMMMILGIKYMTGSAEERAEYKKTLFPYLIGAVLLFAASNLTQVIYSWAINFGKTA